MICISKHLAAENYGQSAEVFIRLAPGLLIDPTKVGKEMIKRGSKAVELLNYVKSRGSSSVAHLDLRSLIRLELGRQRGTRVHYPTLRWTTTEAPQDQNAGYAAPISLLSWSTSQGERQIWTLSLQERQHNLQHHTK